VKIRVWIGSTSDLFDISRPGGGDRPVSSEPHTVNMTDFTDDFPAVIEQNWEISQTVGSTLDVLTLDLDDPNNTINIQQGYDIIIEDYDNPTIRHFGGVIVQVSLRSQGVGRIIRLTAQDWTMLISRAAIRKTYEKIGQTDKSIIQDAVIEQAKLLEIDVSRVQESRTMDVLNFQGTNLTQILNTIAEITGYVWHVDPFKVLHYHSRSFLPQDHAYSDKPDNVTTFNYYGFRLDKNLADWNVIELQGGYGLSLDITDIYSGDGSTKIFITGSQTGTNPIYYPQEDTEQIVVEVNTNTNASPTWTVKDVELEGESGITLGTNADVLWNPVYRRLQFHTAPPNFVNGFRVKGRYHLPIIVINEDSSAIAVHGRRFKGILIINESDQVKQAHDLAMAFLREHSDRLDITFRTNHDLPVVGAETTITSSKFGLTAESIMISRSVFRLLGGTEAEYTVSAQIINHDLYRLTEEPLGLGR
jgi:hypothetical protein